MNGGCASEAAAKEHAQRLHGGVLWRCSGDGRKLVARGCVGSPAGLMQVIAWWLARSGRGGEVRGCRSRQWLVVGFGSSIVEGVR